MKIVIYNSNTYAICIPKMIPQSSSYKQNYELITEQLQTPNKVVIKSIQHNCRVFYVNNYNDLME